MSVFYFENGDFCHFNSLFYKFISKCFCLN